MMQGSRLACIAAVFAIFAASAAAQGRDPVIFIPGLSGSELRHRLTNDRVWFKTVRSGSEDLRLPIKRDPAAMADDLVATDVLRSVKIGPFPVTDVYSGFIRAMEAAGYREELWGSPTPGGDKDSIYVFAYDWRLDNVANARRLVRMVEELKKKLGRPDLRFDIVAHSMGGIIARYAAMYGDADLPAVGRKAVPAWPGEKLFDRIVLLGTPSEGSVLALSNLVEGFLVGGMRLDLPFVQDTSKFMVFTIPAAYQLLPAPGTLRAYDEKLGSVEIDIYDPRTWSKYGWDPVDDRDFAGRFTRTERLAARDYFRAALSRSKRLHEALAAQKGEASDVSFYVVGSDCGSAPDGVVVYRSGKEWRTLFRPASFTRSDGQRVSESELKKVLAAAGDGIVTRRSLEAETLSKAADTNSLIGAVSETMICAEHNLLAANGRIQEHIIGLLGGRK